MATEKEYRYWLCNIPGLGARKISELLRYFGSAESVWKSDELSLRKAMEQASEEHRVFKKTDLTQVCNHMAGLDSAIKEYHKMEERGIRFIIPQDSMYPERLKSLYDMPQGLYMAGDIPGKGRPAVAIVGARNCSHYGEEMAFVLARELCSRGVDIVSGMALGIDGAAHRGALTVIGTKKTVKFVNQTVMAETYKQKNNSAIDSDIGSASGIDFGATYAVLGCGVDICYPRTNGDIFRQLSRMEGDQFCRSGGLISEFPPGTQPAASNFPMRNRIISGLADIVIVVEARFRSGSLITADQALEQGRDVYAIPGRVTDPLSRGCNELIRQGAGIITDPVDFAEKNFPKRDSCAAKRKKNKIALALSEEKVYSCLDFSPTHLGTIVTLTGFSAQDTVGILMQLTMKGLVVETSKNYYALKFR